MKESYQTRQGNLILTTLQTLAGPVTAEALSAVLQLSLIHISNTLIFPHFAVALAAGATFPIYEFIIPLSSDNVDVYKRQGQAVLRTASAAQPPGSASPNRPAGGAPVSAGTVSKQRSHGISSTSLLSPVTVSYTHLDVYKRQVFLSIQTYSGLHWLQFLFHQ